MGSISDKPSEELKNVTVFVTGFGPFLEQHPLNPSYEITKLLPSILPNTTSDGRKIRILAHADPIRVSYEDVRTVVPVLHESLRGIVDLVLHIGMALGRDHYTAEVYAHRDGYSKNKDLDDEVLPPDHGNSEFGDCPAIMKTALDCEELLKKWTLNLSTVPKGSPASSADCKLSEDAGNYLCDYIYFNSLAWFARQSAKFDGGKVTDRPVMFLHVPAESDPETLERGQQVTIALVEAMADNWCSSERKAQHEAIRG